MTERADPCVRCGKPIESRRDAAGPDGPGARLHVDCYWDALGEIVEAAPIGAAGRRTAQELLRTPTAGQDLTRLYFPRMPSRVPWRRLARYLWRRDRP